MSHYPRHHDDWKTTEPRWMGDGPLLPAFRLAEEDRLYGLGVKELLQELKESIRRANENASNRTTD